MSVVSIGPVASSVGGVAGCQSTLHCSTSQSSSHLSLHGVQTGPLPHLLHQAVCPLQIGGLASHRWQMYLDFLVCPVVWQSVHGCCLNISWQGSGGGGGICTVTPAVVWFSCTISVSGSAVVVCSAVGLCVSVVPLCTAFLSWLVPCVVVSALRGEILCLL